MDLKPNPGADHLIERVRGEPSPQNWVRRESSPDKLNSFAYLILKLPPISHIFLNFRRQKRGRPPGPLFPCIRHLIWPFGHKAYSMMSESFFSKPTLRAAKHITKASANFNELAKHSERRSDGQTNKRRQIHNLVTDSAQFNAV